MKLAYFKSKILGDCYAPDNDFCNILHITEKEVTILADDENIVNGPYKILEIPKQDYAKLKSSVQDGDREKAITLLKKLHKENKDTLTSNIFEVKETSFLPRNKEMQKFLNTPAILK